RVGTRPRSRAAAAPRRQPVPGPLLATEAVAAVDGAGGVAGQGGHEGTAVFALAGQAQEPEPDQGPHLGEGLGPAVRAGDDAEDDAAVLLDAGQEGQEPCPQRVAGDWGR